MPHLAYDSEELELYELGTVWMRRRAWRATPGNVRAGPGWPGCLLTSAAPAELRLLTFATTVRRHCLEHSSHV
jgi:hypothetical protein